MLGVALVIGGVIVLIVVGSVVPNLRLNRIVVQHRDHVASEPTDEVVQHVKRIVAENRGMDPTDIFLGMTLEGDLGITGDDATDVFQDFAKGFPDVDLSELDLSLYFGPEGGCAPWVMWFSRSPLRVSDLVQAARDKRWRAPMRPSK